MHWFLDPITKHYFDFQGVASRKQFWMFVLFLFFVNLVIRLLGMFIFPPLTSFVATILGYALALPSWGITVRRFHDVGVSGYWSLLIVFAQIMFFIPFTLIPLAVLHKYDNVLPIIVFVSFLLSIMSGVAALSLLMRKSKIEGNKYFSNRVTETQQTPPAEPTV